MEGESKLFLKEVLAYIEQRIREEVQIKETTSRVVSKLLETCNYMLKDELLRVF